MATNTGDPYVLNVQKWLNETYGNDSRYNIIPENGKTGWTTIYALTRALQIRLGIQSTADNFGPSTERLFNQNWPNGIKQQSSDDEKEDNVYAIIQGALLCKGYATGVNKPTLHFYDGTGNAIKQLKEDAGLSDTSSTVTLNIMKALLSMDYFFSYDTSVRTQKIQEIQRYLNRNYEAYIGISPCDGVYGRATNKALILALQAEEGLPVGIANGNFGDTTKKCCPTIPYNNKEKNYSNQLYNNLTDIPKFTKIMRMGLYANGIGTGDFNNNFGWESDLKSFQTKHALNVTGICDLTTWMSILISCGNTARDAIGCDTATKITSAMARTLADAGYKYIGRYLTKVDGGLDKDMTRQEIEIILKNGLRIFPIFQEDGRSSDKFNANTGLDNAIKARKAAENLGIPYHTTIYFGVDYDPQETEINNYIYPYFKAIYDYFKSHSSYNIGVYGTRNVCRILKNKEANGNFEIDNMFVADASYGFSGNLGFALPNDWAFDQFCVDINIGTGEGTVAIDKVAVSGKDKGFNEITISPASDIYNNLVNLYDLAMEYSGNDKNKSNQLVLQYLRRGEYGDTSIFFGDTSSGNTVLWNQVAGDIDEDYCNLVEQRLGNLKFDFVDPKTGALHEIAHWSATLNGNLYDVTFPFIVDYKPEMKALTGWGGDVLSFSKDIQNKAEEDYDKWAKENICTEIPTKFNLTDYIDDIDAVNLAYLINEYDYSLPEAFNQYYGVKEATTGKYPYETRTQKFFANVGEANFLYLCERLRTGYDVLELCRIYLAGPDKYVLSAINALKDFIYKEIENGN